MALKQPIKTTTNTPAQSTASQLKLPPPQTFDILPPLHELLARVDAYHTSNASTLSGDSPEYNPTLDDDATDIGSAYTLLQPLNPKELPTAVLDIKGRIRNALREVERLPDVDRTVAEQEEEIAELEAKIIKQREMLRDLADVAKDLEGRLGG